MCLFGKRKQMKNKYATPKSRPLKQFMNKIEVWVPTKTYNGLRDMSVRLNRTVEQLSSNIVFDHDCLTYSLPIITNPKRDKVYEDIIGKFIVASLKTGIHIDDVFMNALDSGISQDEIIDALNGLMNDKKITFKDNVFKYVYYGFVKKPLNKLKGVKIKTKDDKPKPKQLVKKLTRGTK